MARKLDPKSLGELVDDFFAERKWTRTLQVAHLRRAWPKVVGPITAGRSFPLSISDDQLVVAAADSTWVQELTLLRPEILARLRESVPDIEIADLRFRVRPGAASRFVAKQAAPPEKPLDRSQLDPQIARALDELEESLAEVEDVDLRRAIRRAFISQYVT